MNSYTIINGDAAESLRTVEAGTVNCCVTSPPYFSQRDYGVAGQIGLESTLAEYVARLTEVFREVRRVLTKDGTCWVNLGDTFNAYNGNRGNSNSLHRKMAHAVPKLPRGYGLTEKSLKNKDMLGVPWRVAFALQAEGWYLRADVIWQKDGHCPEKVKDRPVRAHEYLFLLTKSDRYYFDVHEEVRFRKTIWNPSRRAYNGRHRAVYPPSLVAPCIQMGCPLEGLVLDPFAGSGTTGEAALTYGRNALLIELNPEYLPLIRERLDCVQPCFV